MISIIDYGVGNILAFCNVYKRLNIPAAIARTGDEVRAATKLILPGVGSFDYAMERFDRSGMRPEVEARVLTEKVPILGVCVGMQMLARGSDEGCVPGLGWIPGHVRHFRCPQDTESLPVPHMGWNDIQPSRGAGLFRGLAAGPRFYFLHSYYFDNDRAEDRIASTRYGFEFSSAVQHQNIYGVQFHPEKSHSYGAQVLKNFFES